MMDDGSKDKFYARVYSSNTVSSYNNNVSVQEICDAIFKQKKVKAVGPDGIAMEAFKYSNPSLFIGNYLINY